MYSLISGVGIFFLGAGVTCYHGITGLINPHVVENIPLALSVLSASALVEGCKLNMGIYNTDYGKARFTICMPSDASNTGMEPRSIPASK